MNICVIPARGGSKRIPRKNIKNFNDLTKNFNFNHLGNLDGIGETQINSLKDFFSDQINLNVVKKLISILNIRNVVQNTKGKLINKTLNNSVLCSIYVTS